MSPDRNQLYGIEMPDRYVPSLDASYPSVQRSDPIPVVKTCKDELDQVFDPDSFDYFSYVRTIYYGNLEALRYIAKGRYEMNQEVVQCLTEQRVDEVP